MSRAREILAEVKEQRLTDERVDALKKPWHAQLAPVLAQTPWLVFMIWSVSQAKLPHSAFSIACIIIVATAGIAGVAYAMKTRDRMWRELIRHEAPSLHERLSKKA
jgi:hypothetical protein